MDACGEATRVSYLGGLCDFVSLPFGQTIYIAIVLVAVVLRKVDDLQPFRTFVLCPDSAALAVARAKEEHIDSIEVVGIREALLCIAYESFMHGVKGFAGIAGGVCEDDLCVWVVNQESNQFACCISRSTDYSYFDHSVSSS